MISSVAAFPASIEAIDRSASPDDPAVFEVNVTNDGNAPGSFSVGTFSPKPSWFYVEGSKTVYPGESKTFEITITPGELALDERYSFTVYVRNSNRESSKELKASFNVERNRSLILEDLNIENRTVKPGGRAEGLVKIRSISSNTVKDYRVLVTYRNSTETEKSSPILPGGTRELSFSIPVRENALHSTDELNAVLYHEDRFLESMQENLTVKKVLEVEENSSEKNMIFLTSSTTTVTNTGNIPVNRTVKETLPAYIAPITGFDVPPEQEEKNGVERTFTWTRELAPGETFTVKRTTNIWMPVAAVLGLLAVLVVLKKLRNTVKFEKKVEKVSGGLKVSIEIENMSDRTFKDVEVKDFVSDIATVDKNFEMATPKVRETNEGTRLIWSIEDLEPGDQRVLQYTITPKVEVEGGIELQPAELVAGDEKVEKTSSKQTDA